MQPENSNEHCSLDRWVCYAKIDQACAIANLTYGLWKERLADNVGSSSPPPVPVKPGNCFRKVHAAGKVCCQWYGHTGSYTQILDHWKQKLEASGLQISEKRLPPPHTPRHPRHPKNSNFKMSLFLHLQGTVMIVTVLINGTDDNVLQEVMEAVTVNGEQYCLLKKVGRGGSAQVMTVL